MTTRIAPLALALAALTLGPATAVAQVAPTDPTAPAARPATAAPAGGAITSVVVYSDRAQVTRSLAVDCKGGAAQFPGLPSTLDPKSLWATVSAGSVVGVTYKEEATGPRQRADVLQQQIKDLDVKLTERSAEQETASLAERKLQSMRAHMTIVWGRQSANAKPPVGGWDGALDLLRQQALAAAKKRRESLAAQRELARQRALLYADLEAIERDRRRTTYRATALLQCSGRQTVQLSYVVPGATWRIAYQVRAEPTSGQVTVVAQGIVEQGTGEDWTNTALSVSTANLQRENTPPELRRMRVAARKSDDTRKVLARRFEQREHLSTASGTEKDVAKAETSKKLGGDDRGGAGEPDLGLAMLLPAAGRVTVPSDGRQVVVVLDRRTARAAFGLETVPKLFPFVYNRVALKNPFPFTMLPGNIELYRGRAYLGRASAKLRAPNEPFTLSLGINNQVQVTRYLKKEALEGPGAFGNKKKLVHRYTIDVGNWTTGWQTIRVLENLPVSQQRDIEIKLADDASRPSSWHKEDGILGWDVKVGPRSKKTLVVAYTITLPEAYEVTGY